MLDDFNRECLGIEVEFSLPAERVIRSLNRIIEWRRKQGTIRVDNGPEYISGMLLEWVEKTYHRLNDEIHLTIAVADYRRNADGTIEVLKTGERNEKCYMCSGKLDKQKVCESI